jgi:hypothetical protein
VVFDQQGRGLWIPHANSQAVTSDPRLTDFKQRIAYADSVAHADFAIGQAVNRKVLTKSAGLKLAEFTRPMMVRVQLVDHNRTVNASVAGQVRLPVAFKIGRMHADAARNRRLPNSGSYGPAIPIYFLREADVDGDNFAH